MTSAVVVVSGPNGLRFQNEGHVQRFRDLERAISAVDRRRSTTTASLNVR